jgi:hypothetical protein
MNLTDLQPRWITREDGKERVGFAFLCPHCQKVWLFCATVGLTIREQMLLFIEQIKESGGDVVPARQHFAWKAGGDSFESLSVTPSINAEASGHWHGFVTSGICR